MLVVNARQLAGYSTCMMRLDDLQTNRQLHAEESGP